MMKVTPSIEAKVQVEAIGHSKKLFLFPGASHCGGRVGIAFWFEGEGVWVVPFDEIDRIYRAAQLARGAQPVPDVEG